MLMSIQDRLARKIDRSGGPDACWLWTGGRFADGYGNIYYVGKNRHVPALILELLFNEPAGNRRCLHSCDNPPCCNPAHLRWGTMKENAEDRDIRGRFVRLTGEQHGCAKLTEAQVRIIRRRHKARHSVNGASALAREFGVHTSTVHLIIHGKHWR